MKRELVICLVIIISIIIGDFLLQKFTNTKFDNINCRLEDLKESIKSSDEFDMKKMNEINAEWKKNFDMFTCYLEHDELEKIETQLVMISSGMLIEDKEFVYQEIDRAIFIINHIERKQMFNLDNIF